MHNPTIDFQTIAVDFDGTLCYSDWPECGQPNQALIAFLQEWRRNGNKLILWTCRGCLIQSNRVVPGAKSGIRCRQRQSTGNR